MNSESRICLMYLLIFNLYSVLQDPLISEVCVNPRQYKVGVLQTKTNRSNGWEGDSNPLQ